MKPCQIRKYTIFILTSLVALALVGCETIPKDALQLSPESLEKRSLQTRKYEGILETDILSASAGVIQDLGFTIDESETKLGIIVGSKDRDATDTGQIIGKASLSLLIGILGVLANPGSATPPKVPPIVVDDHQKLRLSLVVRPGYEDDDKKYFVRVTFQRVVWNTQGKVSRVESLDEPEMYQEFFDKLSKAVFLEGHKI